MSSDIEDLLTLIPNGQGRPVSVQPLIGGLTNRNFKIDCGDESYVLRVAGANTELLGIDRACEAACARAAAERGIGPEVVAVSADPPVLVTRFVAGRVLTADETRQPDVLARLVRSLRSYHDGPPGAGRFSPFVAVRNYFELSCDRGVAFPDRIDIALERLGGIESELTTDDPPCPCHNDLLPSNFLDDGTAMRIIDWEYAGMGDRFFDLGNLAVNNQFDAEHEHRLLELYFGAVRPEHLRRLRLMRLASDMREAMWGFLQAGISTLDFDYLAYGNTHLERFLRNAELT